MVVSKSPPQTNDSPSRRKIPGPHRRLRGSARGCWSFTAIPTAGVGHKDGVSVGAHLAPSIDLEELGIRQDHVLDAVVRPKQLVVRDVAAGLWMSSTSSPSIENAKSQPSHSPVYGVPVTATSLAQTSASSTQVS